MHEQNEHKDEYHAAMINEMYGYSAEDSVDYLHDTSTEFDKWWEAQNITIGPPILNNALREVALNAWTAAKIKADKALRLAQSETDGALDESDIFEAVAIMISQRDNARHYADTFRQKLKELGHNYV